MLTLENVLTTINQDVLVIVSINEKDEAGGTKCLGAYKNHIWKSALNENAIKNLEVSKACINCTDDAGIFCEIELLNGFDPLTQRLEDNARYIDDMEKRL